MVEIKKVSHSSGCPILVMGEYHPWGLHKERGGDGSNYPRHSGKILDLKEDKEPALVYFRDILREAIKAMYFAVCVVPSHDPAKGPGGMAHLGQRVASAIGSIDGTSFLVRTKKIEKLAHGGSRAVKVHLDSIEVRCPHDLKGKRLLLLDDVMTSGNSLVACRQLLLEAGAEPVICVAMSQTTY